jgi:hypothetical protein
VLVKARKREDSESKKENAILILKKSLKCTQYKNIKMGINLVTHSSNRLFYD